MNGLAASQPGWRLKLLEDGEEEQGKEESSLRLWKRGKKKRNGGKSEMCLVIFMCAGRTGWRCRLEPEGGFGGGPQILCQNPTQNESFWGGSSGVRGGTGRFAGPPGGLTTFLAAQGGCRDPSPAEKQGKCQL